MKKYSILIIVSLLFLAGCTSPNNDNKTSSSKNKLSTEVTYATTEKVVGLSPIMTNDVVSTNVINQVYECLYAINSETGVVEPLLAEGHENTDDNTWVIHLKKNITFHDGTPFNAEAVKYTFAKIKDPNTGSPRASLLAPITAIEVLDEYSVVLKTEKPYGPMLAILAHANAAIVSPTADKEQDLMTKPVGTGPFQFDKKINGDDIVLKNYADYWGEPAKLTKITFKVVPEINTALSMMETGEVQLMNNVPSDSLTRVGKIDSLEVMSIKSTQSYYVVFNENKEPMNELAFRQAIAYAIDYDSYIAKLNGQGYRSQGVIGPTIFGYKDTIETKGIKYNLKKAQEIVKANNYDSEKLTLTVANTPVYLKIAETIQAQLMEAGFKVEIETLEWGTFLDVTRAGNFTITISSWSNVTADGSEFFYPRLHSNNVGQSNQGQYKNELLDEIINESRETLDSDVRLAKLNQANEYVAENLPLVPLYHSYTNIVHDKKVKGIKLGSSGLWSLGSAYIE